GGACAGDDLERYLAVLALVERVPDRSHPAAAERPQGPVAAEYEAVRSRLSRSLRHPPERFPARVRNPSRHARDRRSPVIRTVGMGYPCPKFLQRPMSEYDDELDFDFFDDEPPARTVVDEEEPTRRQVSETDGGGRPPRRPPTVRGPMGM